MASYSSQESYSNTENFLMTLKKVINDAIGNDRVPVPEIYWNYFQNTFEMNCGIYHFLFELSNYEFFYRLLNRQMADTIPWEKGLCKFCKHSQKGEVRHFYWCSNQRSCHCGGKRRIENESYYGVCNRFCDTHSRSGFMYSQISQIHTVINPIDKNCCDCCGVFKYQEHHTDCENSPKLTTSNLLSGSSLGSSLRGFKCLEVIDWKNPGDPHLKATYSDEKLSCVAVEVYVLDQDTYGAYLYEKFRGRYNAEWRLFQRREEYSPTAGNRIFSPGSLVFGAVKYFINERKEYLEYN